MIDDGNVKYISVCKCISLLSLTWMIYAPHQNYFFAMILQAKWINYSTRDALNSLLYNSVFACFDSLN